MTDVEEIVLRSVFLVCVKYEQYRSRQLYRFGR